MGKDNIIIIDHVVSGFIAILIIVCIVVFVIFELAILSEWRKKQNVKKKRGLSKFRPLVWTEIGKEYSNNKLLRYSARVMYIAAFGMTFCLCWQAKLKCCLIIIITLIVVAIVDLIYLSGKRLISILHKGSSKLGNRWREYSFLEFLVLLTIAGVEMDGNLKSFIGNNKCLKGVLGVILCLFIIRLLLIQVNVIKGIVKEMLAGRFWVTGEMAITLSVGIVFSHVMFFAITVYAAMSMLNAQFILSNAITSWDHTFFIEGVIFTFVTYFNSGWSQLQPNGKIGMLLASFIAHTGFFMYTFLLGAIFTAIIRKGEKEKYMQYFLEIDQIIISLEKLCILLREKRDELQGIKNHIDAIQRFYRNSSMAQLLGKIQDESKNSDNSEKKSAISTIISLAIYLETTLNALGADIEKNEELIKKAEFRNRVDNIKEKVFKFRNDLQDVSDGFDIDNISILYK